MKKLLVFILIITTTTAFSQDWPVKQQVITAKNNGIAFAEYSFFSFAGNKRLPQNGDYQQLKLDPRFQNSILTGLPAAIKLRIPLSNTEYVDCELVRFSLGNIKFTENNNEVISDIRMPATYRGIVVGEQTKNNVMLTVNDDYISLIATFPNRALQICKANEADKFSYRLYNSEKVSFPSSAFDCGTPNKSSATSYNGIDLSGIVLSPDSAQNKCVNVFVDCFDSLYIWRGSNSQQTVDFVIELFNSVATGYLNEQINIRIQSVNVWTTTDPFRGDSRENALEDLAFHYKNAFWGNICVGLDYSIGAINRSGLAGAIGRAKSLPYGMCPVYTEDDHQFCYNDMDYNVNTQNFPVGPNTNGRQVYLVMHEMGHLLGAHHTKWCGWKLSSNPDVYGTLDSCGAIEGSCPQGPPPPASGSTIMSYCVSGPGPTDFVNFNNGFGLLPGNAVRNFVDQNACIGTCLACLAYNNQNDGKDMAHLHSLPNKDAKGYPPSPPGQKQNNAKPQASLPQNISLK